MIFCSRLIDQRVVRQPSAPALRRSRLSQPMAANRLSPRLARCRSGQLCEGANASQILICQRVRETLSPLVDAELLTGLDLAGSRSPHIACERSRYAKATR